MNSSDKNQFDAVTSKQRCLRLRRRILEMSQKVTALHIAPAFSCMEIVEQIYFSFMRRGNDQKFIDTFIMSKGHGCMAQYVALEEAGVLSTEELDRYCTKAGHLGAHPDYGNPGIEASTGSLGHGLSMSIGIAYSYMLSKPAIMPRVYTVLSDGELQEGSTWEAMLLAPSFGINNITCVLDLNDFQSIGRTSETLPNFYPIVDKINSFGWEAIEVDGHDVEALYKAGTKAPINKPRFIIAHTIKGKGVSYMEGVPTWHYRSPSPEEYKKALDELEGSSR